MDLFDYVREKQKETESPLAYRIRPQSLEEVVGQKHILAPGKLLYRMIQADQIKSLIFFGPPGTGKTTIAHVIAKTTKSQFVQLNATCAGKKDMEKVILDAKELRGMYGRKTILFIDEIHRFNKSQQDYLLPFIEDGTLTFIGATTENPYFEVNQALLSRSTLFELKPLDDNDIRQLIWRAVHDEKQGLGSLPLTLTKEAEDYLTQMCDGDARIALNAIELAAMTTKRGEDGRILISLEVIEECIQKKAVRYDKSGGNHYDTLSAFIKSMRGSDPDAAVYYLARMLYAGEDIRIIGRRIMICAAEDVGNADPQAIVVAVSAMQAVERVGMPEARILLAQAAIYVASAPKSNRCYLAVDKALENVRTQKIQTIPPHLQDSHYKGAKEMGRGIGYQYAHDFPGNYVKQQYLPDEIQDVQFYQPTDNGYEQIIGNYLKSLKEETR